MDWTCEFITSNPHLITEEDKNVMIKDIEEQADFGYGDECDKNDWLTLLDVLKRTSLC